MVEPSVRKQLPSVIAAMLVFVIFGTFVFFIADTPDIVKTNIKKLCFTRFFDRFDHSDWLDENEANSRGNNISPSLLWNGIFREIIPASLCNTDEHLSWLSVQIAKTCHFSNSKNTIQIKLLI